MSETTATGAPAARRSAWIPWIFVAGFGVIIAVNGVMVYFALSTRIDVVVEKPYERGISYNLLLDEARAAAALGWTVETVSRRFDETRGVITLDLLLHGPDGPLDGTEVQASLVRPIEGDRIEAPPAFSFKGHVGLALEGVRPGQWDLVLSLRRDGERMTTVERIVLR